MDKLDTGVAAFCSALTRAGIDADAVIAVVEKSPVILICNPEQTCDLPPSSLWQRLNKFWDDKRSREML